ncbi:predicted protein [Naegleria gruberi]|uniref:Predicted protein n=1 Tax=Naegleria gruberi TaxID=5762 RepID=D2VSR4_NAEGR|nr:uncharacterized protein NAEGRDRAFT_72033 [Naegleria gruberi]EFC40165.1 predicted protein [Naegleria gruberi]|eukprot:XP_002672909.1 predicted protein [Naegleria gruberi strain NEG-M]
MDKITPQAILHAEKIIRSVGVKKTSLDTCLSLSNQKRAILFKCENEQITGSFKMRGATHKLMQYMMKEDDNLKKRICTASSGNNGFAVAYVAKAFGYNATVFVPENADTAKIANIRDVMGADIRLYGENCLDTELFAKKYAQENGIPYFSPYNDSDIVMGQGTIGVEIEEQLNEIMKNRGGSINGIKLEDDGSNLNVYVSVGGGGLIGGIARYLKHAFPKCNIIGCQPQNSAVMYHSVNAGKILEVVEEFDTISDGTAGLIEVDTVTFEICQQFVDRYVLSTEEEILSSLKFLLLKEHTLVEGAAACALACHLKDDQCKDNSINVIVLCGKNISSEKIKKILQ